MGLKDDLHSLGFTDGLADHLSHFDPSSLLGFRCQPPNHWASSPISARPITPLWECGTVLVYFNHASNAFEKCSLENPADVWIRHRSVQAVLADLMIELYEDDLSDAELREAARLVGFGSVERLLDEAGSSAGPRYDEWARRFPSTCES